MDKERMSWEGMIETKGIRNAAKAIIVVDNLLLCTKNIDPLGIFYLLPGGGQRKGETLPLTLKRECEEEIGASVLVGDLLYIREYISAHHELASFEPNVHQLEFMFSCQLTSDEKIHTPKDPDSFQLGVQWIPLAELKNYRFYPKELVTHLSSNPKGKGIYLGDIN